jgi:excisionase family DNA binding protein
LNQFNIAAWPALLTDEAARNYLSIESHGFESLVARHRIRQVEVEPAVLRWRKTDLDRLVRYLLPEAEPHSLGSNAGGQLSGAAIAAIASAVAARLAPQLNSSNRIPVHSMSVNDACRTLGLSRSTLYKHISSGALPARKVGKRTLVLAEGVNALLGQVDAGAVRTNAPAA